MTNVAAMQLDDVLMSTAVLLPVGSHVPARDSSLDLSRFDAQFAAALELIERHVSTSQEISEALLALARAACAYPAATDPGAADVDAERQALIEDAPHSLTPDALENFAVYDAYFGVSRGNVDARCFVSGLMQTLAMALADAASAMLGRDELGALLRAIRAMLCRIGSVTPTAGNGTHSALMPALPEVEVDRLTMRWRLGHHLFAYCAMHARDAYADALAAIAQQQNDAVADALMRAALFVRATAAAQWYTSEFPILFYLETLRPSMESAPAHGGFSGTQNADYRRMQWARERVVEALFETYGSDAAAWPGDVYGALMALNETEIQAAEHHVLVAASKVRLDQSLAQKALGASAGHESAVAVLREKVDAIASDIVERFSSHATRRVRACAVAEIPQEHPLAVRLDGHDLVLCRAYGAIWACDGVCPHAGGELADGHMANNEIVCPLHGAKFDPRTGAVLRAPAKEPLKTYTVVIDGDDVLVELP